MPDRATSYHLYLEVSGAIFDPQYVESALGLRPTEFLPRGTRTRLAKLKKAVWTCDLAQGSGESLAAGWRRAVRKLTPRTSRISALTGRHAVRVVLLWSTEWAQGSVLVPTNIMKTIAAAGVPLSISIVSFGRVRTKRAR
jgi:hypothetical protein